MAQQVREQLLANSIGQRLFAKHVLNLSQGTVSELLSKPKPWRKLTEKGKESYRRMAAWISNPNSLQELKDLAPRKGPPGTSSIVKPMEDLETEQKISKILEEARDEMQREQDMSSDFSPNASATNLSKSFSLPMASPANGGSLTDQHKSIRDIAKYVANVQRQELVKLAQAAESNKNQEQKDFYGDEIAKLDERIRLIETMPPEVLSNLSLQSTTQNTTPARPNSNTNRNFIKSSPLMNSATK